MKALRIFVSSPGDVGREREIASRVLKRLQGEFSDRVRLDPYFWEHEPMCATKDFQEQIPQPALYDIVVCILWSRLGTRLSDDHCRPDGTPYASGTEYEFETAAEAHLLKGSPELLVYVNKNEPVIPAKPREAREEMIRQYDALESFIQRWFYDQEKGVLKAAFNQYTDLANFEDQIENHLRRLIDSKAPAKSESKNASKQIPIAWHDGSPFRGLKTFEFEHDAIFFGRTRAIGELIDALRKQASDGHAFVLVLGMSGGGKSSLLRAGLLPLMSKPGAVEGVAIWRRAVMRPGDGVGDLFEGLAAILMRPEALPQLKTKGTSAQTLGREFREHPKAAVSLVQLALTQVAKETKTKRNLHELPDVRLVLVVDQMEALFTLEKISTADRQLFIEVIDALSRCGKVWVIGTLRSDFYHRCAELPKLLELKDGTGSYHLPPPTPAEIGQMIRHPAFAAGLRFEEDKKAGLTLDEILRDSAAKDHASLPLLEFTLEELYKHRASDGTLTLGAYQQLGGVEGALSKRAEEVFQDLSPDAKASFEKIMRALVTISEDSAVTRRRSDLVSITDTPGKKEFIEAFVAARLLVSDHSDTGEPVVDVAHEALLRTWPRIQEWLAADKEFLRIRARVSSSATLWREEKMVPDLLLPAGKPLTEAEDLLNKRRSDLAQEEVEFIYESVVFQRRRAEKEKRRNRIVLSGVSMAMFVAVIFAILATIQWKAAQKEKLVAQNATREAEAATKIQKDFRGRAENLVKELVYGLEPEMKEIGRIDITEKATQRVATYYEKLAKYADPDMMHQRGNHYCYQGDIYYDRGNLEDALASYTKFRETAEQLVSLEPTNGKWQYDLLLSKSKTAEVLKAQGHLEDAHKLAYQSLNMAQKLVQEKPDDLDRQNDLIGSYQQYGRVLEAQGDTDAALKQHQSALLIAEKLQQELPGALGKLESEIASETDKKKKKDLSEFSKRLQKINSELPERLTAAYRQIGYALMKKDQLDASLKSFRQALEKSQEMADANPEQIYWQADLSESLNGLAGVLSDQGYYTQALTYQQQSLKMCKVLAANDTHNATRQLELSSAYQDVGDIWKKSGDLSKAIENYNQSLEVIAPLATANPANIRFQNNLSGTHSRLVEVLKAAKKWDEAEKICRLQITSAEQLAKNDPKNTNLKSNCAFAYYNFGSVLKEIGKAKQAREMLEKGRVLLGEIKEKGSLSEQQEKCLKDIEKLQARN